MIFSHGVWQNAFKGYPFQFGKVEIKDDAWLPWHVFVMPGVTIGKGSTIAGGSVVTKDVPDYCLAGGVPAKIMKQENYPPKMAIDEKNELAKKILHDFEGYSKSFLSRTNTKMRALNQNALLITSDSGNLVYCKEILPDILTLPELRSLNNLDLLSFVIPSASKQERGWIEIDSETSGGKLQDISQEFVQFVGRYGLRITKDNKDL